MVSLASIIPSASTRDWLRSVYRVNPALAGELAWAIHEGTLTDEGDAVNYIQPRVEGSDYAHTHRHGREGAEHDYLVNQQTGKCWFCGQIVRPGEENPAQLRMEENQQLTLAGGLG